MKTLIQKIHYNEIKGHFALKMLLSLISLFYSVAILIKNFLYEKGILKEKHKNAHTICIGNLTTGGVGKTPIVCEIANYLSNFKNNKVVVLSRGYGGKLPNKEPNLIKDFDGIINFDSEQSGDEPFLIAQNTNGCAVITCKNRLLGADYAIKYLESNIIVMDDGFSNRKIKKDLTILVIDSKKQFGNKKLLPLGPLREPIREIKRADKIIIVNKGNVQSDLSFLNNIKKPIYFANFVPDYYYDLKTHSQIKPEKQKVIAFSGIGQPQQFFDFLGDDFEVIKTITYEDHHQYTNSDIEKLERELEQSGASAFVTTEKDGVKIKNFLNTTQKEFFILKLKIQINAEAILRKEN